MMTSTLSLEQLQQENTQLRNEISILKEQLEWFRRQIFGQKSEKIITGRGDVQLLFEGFDKLENNVTVKSQIIPTHERKKASRNGQDQITIPAGLPVERQIIDLPEKEKVCPETGQPFIKIGEEVSHKLAHKPGKYYIKEIIRPKYALPKKSEEGIRTAPMPESLLQRCQADDSLLSEILTKKFVDHLPLYRISEIFSREGIGISRQTLSQWVIRCGKALKPLYDEMFENILDSKNVFVDETPVDMLDPGRGKVRQTYMWVLAGGNEADPPYRVYQFFLDRKHCNAAELLPEYGGVLHSDKYGAYETLANKKQIIWCPCWAHIRRKFFEAESGDPPFREWVLGKMHDLFMLEKEAWGYSEEERLRIRQEREVPIIDELIEGIRNRLIKGNILPKSKFREALCYFCGLIPYLKNYTKYPYARLDNNIAERAVRPLAIGRKNWLFFGNEEGGEAAAVILSLVQTCRAIGVNPREYLEDVMRRLMSHNSQKLYELLPDQWLQSRKNPVT